MNLPMNRAAPTMLRATVLPMLSNNGLLSSFVACCYLAPHVIVGAGHGPHCGFVGS